MYRQYFLFSLKYRVNQSEQSQVIVDRHECPFNKNILISDVNIKVKTGGSRTLDRVYSDSLRFYRYLRYGLTYIEILEENKESEVVIEDTILGRRGLMRVFEFKIDYALQDIDTIGENTKIISQKDYNIRKYILGQAFEALETNHEFKQPELI